MQIAALTIIGVILVEFYQHKRLGTISNKMFEAFLWCSLINVASEMLTLYTIWNMDRVGERLNRFAHQIFICSLDWMILFLFLYVDIKSRKQKRYTEQEWIYRLTPAMIALVLVLFGRLEYHVDEFVRYSYGPMAMTVYFSAAVYLVWMFRVVNRTEGVFDQREKWNIRAGILAWMLMAVIQLIKPEALISSLATVMMVVFLYIAFEDPQSYVDAQMERVMNEHAFQTSLTAVLEQRHPFWVLQITAVNAESIVRSCGEEKVLEELQKIAQSMRVDRKQCVYHISDYSMGILLYKDKHFEKTQGRIKGYNAIPLPEKQSGIVLFSFQILAAPELGHTVEEIERVAQFSEKTAFERNRQEYCILDATLLEQMYRQEAMEKLVEQAVLNGELDVYYQPIYSAEDGCFHSVEALVRLQDATTLGYISPEYFVPIVEKKGLADQLGRIVLRKVCEFASREKIWQYGIKYVEVNLSALQAADERLPEKLLQDMEPYGIQPEFINLEITETATVESDDQVTENMTKLKESGFQFSMDDFGTGYSNLSKMAESNFDLVKLDKSLIWPCFEEDGEKARVILEASILMVHRLGLKIVAEGVETKEQSDFLKERGVEYLQGYLYSKPISEERFIEFLHVEYIRKEMLYS